MSRRFLPTLIALLAASATCHGGAWVREEGGFYVKAALARTEADRLFNTRRDRVPTTTYRDTGLSLYGEYGLTPAWTAIASLEAKDARRGGARSTGPADLWIAGKRLLLSGPFVLSAQLGAKLPMGYAERSRMPLGEGQVDLEARVLAGKSFGRAYGSAEIGYRKRNGDYSDEVPFRVEGGVRFVPRAMLLVSLDGWNTTGNDRASKAPSGSLHPNVFDKEFMSLRPALLFFLTPALSLEVFHKIPVDGANATADKSFGIGVAWEGKGR